jgi:ABC-type lipopolysaccharide export system ATPase subunit
VEPDTEHERIPEEGQNEADEADETDETFSPQNDVNKMVVMRMNHLAGILKRKTATNEAMIVRDVEVDEQGEARAEAEAKNVNRERKREELDALLQEFKDKEVSPECFAQVSLNALVLLLLARHRSFRVR